ncbi:MAG: nucleotidyltransferase, partial [Nitrospinaceae bacterium]|nr:nucleotidyltransferase [Nitrospinaceae bacterium]
KDSFFDYLAEGFSAFLESAGRDEKTEFYLPEAVNRLANTGRVSVEVLSTVSRWYGVTYAPERDDVIKAVQGLVASG